MLCEPIAHGHKWKPSAGVDDGDTSDTFATLEESFGDTASVASVFFPALMVQKIGGGNFFR